VRSSETPREAWVDANVILRLLTNEPESMADAAQRLVERAEAGEIVLKLSAVVVAEIVWVLGSFYKTPKAKIAETLTELIMADGFAADDRDLLVGALYSMADKNVDFVDAFLAALARSREDAVASFDDDFKRLGVRHILP